MTDLDVVFLAVAAAGRPISAIDVCDLVEMDREPVGKALGTLYTQGRLLREGVPNTLAGKTGQRKFMYVYTPADAATCKDGLQVADPVAETTGDDPSPIAAPAAQKPKSWRDFSYGNSPTLIFDERAAKTAKPSKAKQVADGWIDEAIQAAALLPRPRWLVTPMGRTLDTREAALDEAARLAASEGLSFAVVRLEAVASVKVEIEWEA